MSKRQLSLWALQILLFTSLGSLQFVDPNSGDPNGLRRTVCAFIYGHRLPISIGLGLLFAVITGWKTLFYPRKRSREIRQKILETMLDEEFGGDKNNYRITIFRDANLLKRILIYIKLSGNRRRVGNSGKVRGRFVYVWERLGTEHPHSKTFYYYTRETAKDCQGVAGTVMQSLTDIAVPNLPYIEEVDLSQIDAIKGRGLDAKRVRDYMRRSYIKDIETLRRLNRKPLHIYGNILNSSEGAQGVLVIDSFLEESFLREDVQRRLTHYAIMIGATM